MNYVVSVDVEVEAVSTMAAEAMVLDMIEKIDADLFATVTGVKEVSVDA